MSRNLIAITLTLILASLSGGSAVAEFTRDIEARNKAIVQDRFDAWKAGTGSPFELLTEDATWTVAGRSSVAKTYPNRAAFMNEVIKPFNARMREGLKPSIREILADGDRVTILFDAYAVARDEKPYTNTYAWFLDMRNGKIVGVTALFDSIEFNDLWQRVQPRGD